MAFQLGASSSSSSSSPSIHPRNHDVFLSFRGEDVRHKFISHLNRALCQSGIKTYVDSVGLERGEQISSLFKAIEESRISIIVFSKNYAESKWCLDELLKILECKKLFKQIVLPIFYEIKPSDIREQKGSFGEAFTKLGKEIKDDKKPLEYWKEALEEVAKLSGFEYKLASGDDESKFIQDIIQWVNSRIPKQTPLYVAEYPIEIESRIRAIYQLLSLEKNDIIRMVGIFGIGGIGKTTFSKDIYNKISSQFEGCCFLSNIKERSKREGLIELQKILLSEILGKTLDIYDADRGVNVIRDSLHFKRVLLILDDVDELTSSSGPPNYLSNELRVLDWFEYPLQSLPPNFHGKNLIIFKMRGSCIKELSFIKCSINYKDMTIMHLQDCDFLTKVPDLSSVPNLTNLDVEWCTSLVEVHDSVGSLENLFHLRFSNCSNLRIFPRSLKLRSLNELDLIGCSSLRCFPEIPCEMKSLNRLNLLRSAVEELPLSIGNLTGLQFLYLSLPLQHLTTTIGGCTNMLKKMGHDRQSILAIESPTMEDEISSSEEQLQKLAPTTNSSNGSSELQVLNCRNCFQSESNFFPRSSFFTMFNFSATLTYLNLSRSQIVSLPKSIKGFVKLVTLELTDCKKLEEILELPPNIRHVNAYGCRSLERFPELSRILEFNGSHNNRLLCLIDLRGCNKMHVKIWNYKVPNPLLWKGHYNATLLLENEIPEWFRYHKEFLENEIAKRGDDDVQLKGNEEWVINIEGPHYLEDISGIVIYVVAFFNEFLILETSLFWNAEVIINSSNCYTYERQIVTGISETNNIAAYYQVWTWYSDLESFEVKVLDNLRVQLRIPPNCGDPLGDLGSRFRKPYYISMGANVVYKKESRAHKRRKMV